MISYASNSHISAIKKLWKDVFGDSNEFLNLYFTEIFKCEQCLVCHEGNQVLASLQMLPYTTQVNGARYESCYIFAVMTVPAKRRKGYMRQLMEFALQELKEKNIALAFLIPQEPYLFDIYAKFGFKKAFFSGKKKVMLASEPITFFEPNISDAYQFYLTFYRNKNLVLQSSAQFTFMAKSVETDSGDIIAVGNKSKIDGLCICIKVGEQIRVLDFMASDTGTEKELESAIRARYNTDCAIISQYSYHSNSYPGMYCILDGQMPSSAEMENTYLSLMMDE